MNSNWLKEIRNAKVYYILSLTVYLHTLFHPEKDTAKRSYQDPQRSTQQRPVKNHIETIIWKGTCIHVIKLKLIKKKQIKKKTVRKLVSVKQMDWKHHVFKNRQISCIPAKLDSTFGFSFQKEVTSFNQWNACTSY